MNYKRNLDAKTISAIETENIVFVTSVEGQSARELVLQLYCLNICKYEAEPLNETGRSEVYTFIENEYDAALDELTGLLFDQSSWDCGRFYRYEILDGITDLIDDAICGRVEYAGDTYHERLDANDRFYILVARFKEKFIGEMSLDKKWGGDEKANNRNLKNDF